MKTPKLDRAEIITTFSKAYGVDLTKFAKSIRVKVIDHDVNKLAPERYCYKISFTLFGKRSKFGFWPNTVGYQGY